MMTAAMCLALNIFFEARNEPVVGQLMVAEVTLNRVDSPRYPNSICEVVWQPSQFSWTHDGLPDKPEKMLYLDRVAWKEILKLSDSVLKNPHQHLTYTGATHYHADYTKPYWASSMYYIGKVGSHLFYSEK